MKKHLFVALSLLSLNGFASSHSISLEGNYGCTGKEVGTNEAYQCNMSIKKTGETYLLKSTCSDNTSYHGTGIYDQKLHRFSSVFINPKRSKETGIGYTKVQSNGRLDTTWTYINHKTVTYSQCTKK